MYANFTIDPTLFLQFVNIARMRREGMRPFKVLTKRDTSQIISASNAYTTPHDLPSDFEYLTDDGLITLFDGNDTWQQIEEFPKNLQIQYKDYSNKFYIDNANGKFYIMGIVDKQYSAYIFYQADLGDITLTTSWVNIPARYHMILALDVLAMYMMGVDYDDVQARNANELARQAELIWQAIVQWDDNLQRSATTRMNYGSDMLSDAPFISNQINIR